MPKFPSTKTAASIVSLSNRVRAASARVIDHNALSAMPLTFSKLNARMPTHPFVVQQIQQPHRHARQHRRQVKPLEKHQPFPPGVVDENNKPDRQAVTNRQRASPRRRRTCNHSPAQDRANRSRDRPAPLLFARIRVDSVTNAAAAYPDTGSPIWHRKRDW
jgi:hypothetical protein